MRRKKSQLDLNNLQKLIIKLYLGVEIMNDLLLTGPKKE